VPIAEFQEIAVATKIGGFDSSPVQVSTGRSVKRGDSSDNAVKSSSAEPKSDTQITDSAKKLAALEQSVRDLPAIDESRVQQVSAKLSSGAYKIDAGRIADKLLRSEQDLADLEQ
jgi:negative regulator of flagellin synthesis FlgM